MRGRWRARLEYAVRPAAAPHAPSEERPCDNWAEHPFDFNAHVEAGEDPEPRYPFDLLKPAAAKWISGTVTLRGDPRRARRARGVRPHYALRHAPRRLLFGADVTETLFAVMLRKEAASHPAQAPSLIPRGSTAPPTG
ncbi:hypothetical protein [Streptomyces sp. NPDC016845]|uniref:hypothetical protein n=1 Tax=Streptomyces sp. NPDC016845 TaxID=3364972 RepID=UPI0037BB1E53